MHLGAVGFWLPDRVRRAIKGPALRRSGCSSQRKQGKIVLQLAEQMLVGFSFAIPAQTQARLWLGSALDERPDVVLQLGAVVIAYVHHVPCAVILQVDVAAQLFRQEQMLHGEFRTKKWRG